MALRPIIILPDPKLRLVCERIERIDGILCNPALNQGARLAADVFRIGFGMFHVKHSRGTSPSGSADKNVSRETSIASFPQLSR